MRNTILSKNNPYNVRQLYPSKGYFKLYLYTLSIQELKEVLERFTTYEFYEDCVVIDQVIKEKIKYIVTP